MPTHSCNPGKAIRVMLSWALLASCLWLAGGCATPPHSARESPRKFDFSKDAFAYPNELVWEYRYDSSGKWTTRRREPPPSYYQHCFVVSRAACQFFENATFAADRPRVNENTYRELVRRVIAVSPRTLLPPEQKIVFPGYADLRSFSAAHEDLLKSECGGAWRCYVQRGNWRMIFPFSRRHQEKTVQRIQDELGTKGVAVVHLVRFPQLSINHAVLIYGARTEGNQIQFPTYDPNDPSKPTLITFDRPTRTFSLPSNSYFPGGRVDVYPIYDRLLY